MYMDYNMFNNYYGFNGCNYRNSNSSSFDGGELITLNQAIELIRKAIGDEKSDEIFYDSLIESAPTQKEKDIIMTIRDDEIRHNQILRKLYFNFTGQIIPENNSIETQTSDMDYRELLEKALFGELEAMEKYRKILGNMPSGDSYTLIMSIMTDEMKHAIKYNFLLQNLAY